jgi:F0F1-type ATP synthase membrane subunit b/b'
VLAALIAAAGARRAVGVDAARAAPSVRVSRIDRWVDVLVLIERLDELVRNAKAVPLSEQVRLDRDEIFELLDEVRATIPEEVRQARLLVKERQQTLADAAREVERLVAEAHEEATRANGRTEIVRLAERQADELISEARWRANTLLSEVEESADGTLALLEANLDNFLAAIRRGRQRLRERSRETVVAGVRPDGTSEPRGPDPSGVG